VGELGNRELGGDLTRPLHTAAIRRILVVRLGAMGDVIHALPAVAKLRAMLPAASIDWVIEERWAELLCSRPIYSSADVPCCPQKPLVNTVQLVNTRAWRRGLLSPRTWRQIVASAARLREPHYDVALDFQGAWKSALVTRISGAQIRIGFAEPWESGAGIFYTSRVAAKGSHVIEQNDSLLSALGPIPDDNECTVSLPRDQGHDGWAREELERLKLFGSPFALINPGAGWGGKRWPATRYAALARGLAEFGLPPLINCGPGEEPLARAVQEESHGTAKALACGIGQLIALMRQARLFVGGDTGPMHMAALLRVPVVAIFGPTDPARNGPLGTPSVVLRSPASVTDHSRRAPIQHAMLSITVQDVLQAARNLLAANATRVQPHGEVPRG
jgi:heptosyltransferase-1